MTADESDSTSERTAGAPATRSFTVGAAHSLAYGPAASATETWALRFTTADGERVTVQLNEDAMYRLWSEVHNVPWPRDGTERDDLQREVAALAEGASAETLRDVLDLLGGDDQ